MKRDRMKADVSGADETAVVVAPKPLNQISTAACSRLRRGQDCCRAAKGGSLGIFGGAHVPFADSAFHNAVALVTTDLQMDKVRTADHCMSRSEERDRRRFRRDAHHPRRLV